MMKKITKRLAVLATSFTTVCPMVCTPVYATDGLNITELEKKISDDKSDLEKTEENIKNLEQKIKEEEDKLIDINTELEKYEEERLELYEKIKLRIKYLYENGDNSMMEALVTQNGYKDVLNKAELSSNMHTYDREMLESYAQLLEDIEKKQIEQENVISDLKATKDDLEKFKTKLEKTIEEDEKTLDDAKKKAAEEKRKKEEEAKRKAKAAKQQPTGTVKRVGNTYSYCEEDMYLIYAIVMQEAGGSYDGALAVITCACNRAESSKWGYIGSDPLTQLTAKGQFCYSIDSYWKKYLNNNVSQCVRDAVRDALNGTRSHQFLSFRGYRVNGGTNIGGNYFFQSM